MCKEDEECNDWIVWDEFVTSGRLHGVILGFGDTA